MLIRYPGGKRKIRKVIIDTLKACVDKYQIHSYVEPFFGSGAICFELLRDSRFFNILINDKDPDISSLWTTVIRQPRKLQNLINNFHPSLQSFYDFKDDLLTRRMALTPRQRAFQKIVVHQASYSGLGLKGGPLGGACQESEYKIDCRWSPKTLCKNIRKASTILRQSKTIGNRCYGKDFDDILRNLSRNTLVYLDPPYYEMGNELYQHGFTKEDHERLRFRLKRTFARWVLSYDDNKTIRRMYRWTKIIEIPVTYTIGNVKKDKELLILSPYLAI